MVKVTKAHDTAVSYKIFERVNIIRSEFAHSLRNSFSNPKIQSQNPLPSEIPSIPDSNSFSNRDFFAWVRLDFLLAVRRNTLVPLLFIRDLIRSESHSLRNEPSNLVTCWTKICRLKRFILFQM